MSAQTYTIFDSATRLPITVVTCTAAALKKRLREGQTAIPGSHRGSVRLNDANEPEHDATRANSDERDRRRNARKGQIEALERVRSPRAERELLLAIAEHLGLDNTREYARLKEISQEIEAFRPELQDPAEPLPGGSSRSSGEG